MLSVPFHRYLFTFLLRFYSVRAPDHIFRQQLVAVSFVYTAQCHAHVYFLLTATF